MSVFIRDSLSVWTGWPLLGSARTQAIIVIVLAGAKAALPSLVRLLCIRTLAARHGLPASHHVRGLYATVVLAHLVVESCGSSCTFRSTTAALFSQKQLLQINF